MNTVLYTTKEGGPFYKIDVPHSNLRIRISVKSTLTYIKNTTHTKVHSLFLDNSKIYDTTYGLGWSTSGFYTVGMTKEKFRTAKRLK